MKCDNGNIHYTEEWMLRRRTGDILKQVMPYDFELYSGYQPAIFAYNYVMVVDKFPYTVQVDLEGLIDMRNKCGSQYIERLAIKIAKDLIRLFDIVQNSYGRNIDEEDFGE